jgi:hypothetical protein
LFRRHDRIAPRECRLDRHPEFGPSLGGRQAMMDRAIAFGTRSSIRRIGSLLVIVLPVILAACGKGGASGY